MNNKRILIVDDNKALHEDYRKILVGETGLARGQLAGEEVALFGEKTSQVTVSDDYELDFAFQGQEALEKVVKAFEEGSPYALVFMDVRMPPGWDGITTVSKIWEKAPLTEVVICTAYSDYSLEDVVAKLGKSEHFVLLKKPFDSAEVQQLAIALTRKWNLQRAAMTNTENLELLVQERTKELSAERAKSVHGAKLMALGEMAGGIAHEINNPLAIIHANANLLSSILDEKFDKAMALKITSKIIQTTDRIAKIVKGLRSFSRSGETDPTELVVLAQLFEETISICRERFSAHDVKINFAGEFENISLECRKIQIVHVLLNLLNNAFDAVKMLPEKWVRFEVCSTGHHLEISLTDSGSGLSDVVKNKLFQPFFTTKEIGKGTGLGLSVSKNIVESHGGELVFDETKTNTTFVLRMPIRQDTKNRKVA